MNLIVMLTIALFTIIFLLAIITLLRIFIDNILERDLFMACVSGLAVVGVCLAAILFINIIWQGTKQVVCTDYQVEERVDSFDNTTFVITYER